MGGYILGILIFLMTALFGVVTVILEYFDLLEGLTSCTFKVGGGGGGGGGGGSSPPSTAMQCISTSVGTYTASG